MAKDSIDSMIESWASGLGASTRVSPEAGSDELADFKPPKETTPLDAAQAIASAIEADAGRRKKYTTWSAVAREVLGLQRLSNKRFEGVLEAGYRAKLFKLDSETLSYPFLVLCPPEPEPKAEPVPEEGGWKRRELKHRPRPPSEIPEDWHPLSWLPCGHHDCQTITDPETGERATARITQPGPEHCPACAEGKRGDPRYQVGEWRTPVPPRDRRTEERAASKYGFPGLCSDPKTGFYIGGIGNDCRHYHDGPERCECHKRFLNPAQNRKEGGGQR
jgi:hypothetical protein